MSALLHEIEKLLESVIPDAQVLEVLSRDNLNLSDTQKRYVLLEVRKLLAKRVSDSLASSREDGGGADMDGR